MYIFSPCPSIFVFLLHVPLYISSPFYHFSPLTTHFSLSLNLSHAQKGLEKAMTHVFIVLWQSYSSRNEFILYWRLTQTGSNCAITKPVWWMKSKVSKTKNMTCIGLMELTAGQVNCRAQKGDSLDFLGLANIWIDCKVQVIQK